MGRRTFFFLSIIASVALASCHRETLRIEGNLSSAPDGTIYLSTLDSSFKWVRIDSSFVRDGQFVIEDDGHVSDPECLRLSVGNQNLILFAGKGSLTMTGSMLQPEKIEVLGSADNDRFVSFFSHIPGRQRRNELIAALGVVKNDVDSREDIQKEIRSIEREQELYVRRSISENYKEPFGLFVLVNNLRLFTFEQSEAQMTHFDYRLHGHKYYGSLKRLLDARRQYNNCKRRVDKGQIAPNFILSDLHGDTVSLDLLRGNTVLLCFWSLDSARCVEENAALHRIYPTINAKGIEMICVHTGGSRDRWIDAVSKEQMPGFQLFDNGDVAKTYCITQVPFAFLIDEYGNIISKDNTGLSVFHDIDPHIY